MYFDVPRETRDHLKWKIILNAKEEESMEPGRLTPLFELIEDLKHAAALDLRISMEMDDLTKQSHAKCFNSFSIMMKIIERENGPHSLLRYENLSDGLVTDLLIDLSNLGADKCWVEKKNLLGKITSVSAESMFWWHIKTPAIMELVGIDCLEEGVAEPLTQEFVIWDEKCDGNDEQERATNPGEANASGAIGANANANANAANALIGAKGVNAGIAVDATNPPSVGIGVPDATDPPNEGIANENTGIAPNAEIANANENTGIAPHAGIANENAGIAPDAPDTPNTANANVNTGIDLDDLSDDDSEMPLVNGLSQDSQTTVSVQNDLSPIAEDFDSEMTNVSNNSSSGIVADATEDKEEVDSEMTNVSNNSSSGMVEDVEMCATEEKEPEETPSTIRCDSFLASIRWV